MTSAARWARYAPAAEQRSRMLAHEPGHRAQVPDRVPREERPVDHRRVVVPHPRGRHVPPLPTRARGAIGEVDVLPVHPEAGVPTAELVEHRPPQEQEGAEQVVGSDGLGRTLVEAVVTSLEPLRREEQPQRRPPDERRAGSRERAAGRLPAAVGVVHLRPGDPAARPGVHEVAERCDRARLGHGVRVRDEDVVAGARSRAEVRVRRIRPRPLVLDDARPGRQLRRQAVRHVRDDDELVHLLGEHR
jgi:hypothetical protein